jgi:hypothetical protein
MMPTEPSKTLHIREGRSMSVLALALWAMFLPAARGWTMGSAVSGFSGSVLLVDRPSSPSSSPSPNSNPSFLTMKKGKANVPPQMRGQYEKQKEMMAQREAMIAATKPGADGFPVFNLFVRTKRANVRPSRLLRT